MARHPAFAPEEIERQRQQAIVDAAGELRRSRSSLPTRCSIGWSTASIRTACRRAARRRRWRRLRATTSWRSTQNFVAQQRHSGDRRRRHGRGGVRRRAEGVRRLAAARGGPSAVHRAARADTPRDRGQQARCGADRSARRAPRDQAQSRRLHGAQPDASHPRRRRREPAAPGAARRARPHLRREGRHGHAARKRRLRSLDQHALRGDGRSAAADRRRVLAAAARAGRRTRAVGRQGVPDRKLSADDRNARRDRDAGAERAVLRPAGRAAADVPRRV